MRSSQAAGTRAPGNHVTDREFERELSAAREKIAALEQQVAEQRAELSAVQATLQLANDYLTDLLQAVSDALLVVDDAHMILTVNRAALHLLGYQDHELLGEDLALVAPSLQADDTPDVILEAVALGAASSHREFSLRTKDGREVPVLLTVSRLQDRFGDLVYVLAATDMRERLRLESELHHNRRLESLGQLSAGVAHEINNPLGYVIGNLDFLRDELPEDWQQQVPEAARAIEQAYEGAMRVREVVSDLLSFARTGGDTLESVDVNQVLESTVRLVSAQLKSRARLIYEPLTVPRVRAQRARLGQVFLNLIVNAIQALPVDQLEQNRIWLATSACSNGQVSIEVRDNGPGIPDAVCERIFEPFFTTKKPGEGTGLGLSICHGIVKRFGGELTVTTKTGVGTSFFVRLQVAERDSR